jgi:hypothetical protein
VTVSREITLISRRRFLIVGGGAVLGAIGVLGKASGSLTVAQRHWRFCHKCQALFYDGYQEKGRCAAGGAHVAQGYNFVLPHFKG